MFVIGSLSSNSDLEKAQLAKQAILVSADHFGQNNDWD